MRTSSGGGGRRLRAGEGYGTKLVNEPEPFAAEKLPNPWLAVSPARHRRRDEQGVHRCSSRTSTARTHSAALPGLAKPVVTQVSSVAAIWAVEGALLLGILTVVAFAFRPLKERFAEGSKAAVAGALLAATNTASEYGFGAVIAALPGFLVVAEGLKAIPGVLVNEAVTVTALAGITGSASGGMSIALATMADSFIAAAQAAGIPLEVLHRIAAMASGGMDTLPHNGAVITLLAVTGLTHQRVLPRHLRDHAAQDRRRGSGDRRVLPDRNLLIEPEHSRAVAGELARLALHGEVDRCSPAIAAAYDQDVAPDAQVERVLAVANPHVEPLEPLRQARVEAQHVARHLDARSRRAARDRPCLPSRPGGPPRPSVPCWMSLTSLCSASAK